jgi:hypothetical protein
MSRTINIPSAITKIEELLAKVREAVSGETTKPSKKRNKATEDEHPKKRGNKVKSAKKQKVVKEEKVRVRRGDKQKPIRVTPDGNKKVVKHSRLRAVKRVKDNEEIVNPKKAKKVPGKKGHK